MPKREALFYDQAENNKVKCRLCPQHCILKPGQTGLCRVRHNQEGSLYTVNYGEVVSLALDPIEKKPLYHFYPGKEILSAGTFGCNLSCAFCQNYTLAHETPDSRYISVDELVGAALSCQEQGSVGIAFTYNEPAIWYEYVYEAAVELKNRGLKVVLVTNGYIEEEPLKQLLPYVDAMNIDVKAFSEQFYHRNCKGRLEAVKQSVQLAAENTHVEVTNLIIPGENDDLKQIEALAGWLASINRHIPLHLSRYHPAYKFTQNPTPRETLIKAREAAHKYLDFVYVGNLMDEENSTLCLECGQLLVKRNVYLTRVVGLKQGRCSRCQAPIDYFVG